MNEEVGGTSNIVGVFDLVHLASSPGGALNQLRQLTFKKVYYSRKTWLDLESYIYKIELLGILEKIC